MDFSNFLPLVAVIRADHGPDWEFYQEFLENVIDSAGRGEDTSAWYDQIEALVGEQDGLRFSHEGVCFLLRGLEAKAREARVPASDRVPSQSRNTFKHPGDIAKRTPLPLTASNMSSPPPQNASLSKQSTPQADDDTSQASITILGPPEPPNLFSVGYHSVLFTDATFKRDIHNYFHPAVAKPAEPDKTNIDKNKSDKSKSNKNKSDKTNSDEPKVIPPVRDDSDCAPPYYAKDDDLTIWKKRVEEDTGVKVNMEAKAASGESK